MNKTVREENQRDCKNVFEVKVLEKIRMHPFLPEDNKKLKLLNKMNIIQAQNQRFFLV